MIESTLYKTHYVYIARAFFSFSSNFLFSLFAFYETPTVLGNWQGELYRPFLKIVCV